MTTRKSYAYEIKKQAVELYFEGSSTNEIAARLEIQNPASIRDWARQVKETKSFDVLREKRRGPRDTPAPKTELEVTKAKLERSELENMYLKKLIALRKG